MKAFVLPTNIFTLAATYVYRFFYLLYYFFFKHDITSSAKEISFDNPFTGLTEHFLINPFGGIFRPVFESIEKIFRIDLSITPLELLVSSAVILIFVYAIIKFLVPLF